MRLFVCAWNTDIYVVFIQQYLFVVVTRSRGEYLQYLWEFIIKYGQLIVGLPKKIMDKGALRPHRGLSGGDNNEKKKTRPIVGVGGHHRLRCCRNKLRIGFR